MWYITLMLPEEIKVNGKTETVMLKNYWAGQKRDPTGIIYEEWGAIDFAISLTPKQSKKQLLRLIKLIGSENAKRELITKFSKS